MGSSKVSAPAARQYLGEMQSALFAQAGIQEDTIALERRWTPEWQKLQGETLRGQMGILSGLYESAMPQAARLGQMQVDAMAPVMANAGSAAMSAYQKAMGPEASGLLSTMQRQAASDLSMGRGLSPEEQSLAQQQARAAMQARGLQGGNQAVAMEVLSGYDLSNQREAQRRAYAQNVYGISQASMGNAYNQYGTPLMGLIGSTSPGGLLSGAGGMAGNYGPSIFNPESSYNAALISANRKEQMDAQVANANSKAAVTGAGIGAAGAIGAALI